MRFRSFSRREPATKALLQAVVGCPATKSAGKVTVSALRTAVTAGQTESSLELVRHTSEARIMSRQPNISCRDAKISLERSDWNVSSHHMRGLPHCCENQSDRASTSTGVILASATDLGSGRASNLLKKWRKRSSNSIERWISHGKSALGVRIQRTGGLLSCNQTTAARLACC